jgi:hypothetical protein
MREVSYKLADGTVTKSYAVVQASGQRYETRVTPVVEARTPMSEERRKKLAEKFGWKD